ncbi:MAG: hypothetical protein ACLP59_23415 [Bryobacteraceae bacterium]
MPSTNRLPKRPRNRPVRQSVTIPGPLAVEVRRVARERQLTISRALVALAETGVRAEAEAKENLKAAYSRFMETKEPASKEEAGRDLIRAVFGNDSLAGDTVL